MNVVAPYFVVALHRGGELEPIAGIAQRFTPAEVIEVDVPPAVMVKGVSVIGLGASLARGASMSARNRSIATTASASLSSGA